MKRTFAIFASAFLSLLTSQIASAAQINVTPSMYSGNFSFFASSYSAFASPGPYGVTNNDSGNGWIWNNGSYFIVDFGAATALDEFRVWSVYGGGQRGGNWQISYSDDDSTFTTATNFLYQTSPGTGVNGSNVATGDYSGWYESDFNAAGDAHRYWEIMQTSVTVDHSPRSGEVQFFAAVPEPGSASVILLGLPALIKRRRIA